MIQASRGDLSVGNQQLEGFASAWELLQSKMAVWAERAVVLLPNAVLSALIFVLSLIIGHYLSRLAFGTLSRFFKNVSLVKFLAAMIRLAVLLVGVVIALNLLELDQAAVSLLAGVGVLGIILGFAFQDLASNFISGVALVFRDDRPFRVGDLVETNSHFGIIREINLRDTALQSLQGQMVFIPNKQIFQEPVINFSFLRRRRIDLTVGISYGEDLERARRITMEAVAQVRHVVKDSIDLYYEEFGESSINFVVRFWVPFRQQTDYLAARSEAIINIKKAYDANGITIPFPIRTLDFGIKGGMTLGETLESVPHA